MLGHPQKATSAAAMTLSKPAKPDTASAAEPLLEDVDVAEAGAVEDGIDMDMPPMDPVIEPILPVIELLIGDELGLERGVAEATLLAWCAQSTPDGVVALLDSVRSAHCRDHCQ
jgi:hypothetical protein